jgi:membrane-associated phospholipid phosphatase
MPNCDYADRTSIFCHPAKPSGFRLWNATSDPLIIGAAAVTPFVLAMGGALVDSSPFVELGMLALEAVAVSQVYHVGIKVLTDREGPLSGNGSGAYHGPSVTYFPDGYPSGHSTVLFAIVGVYATYFDRPWLTAVLLGAASALSVMLVIDDSHFASEVIAGAALGYFVGRWVVIHRSTHYVSDSAALPIRLTAVTPLQVPGGAGLSASFAF